MILGSLGIDDVKLRNRVVETMKDSMTAKGDLLQRDRWLEKKGINN